MLQNRWHYCLDPKINRGGWTANEDRLILKLQKLHGNQWSKIAKLMTGRTGYAVRNRYNGIMKKAKLAGRTHERLEDDMDLSSDGSQGDMASEVETSSRDSSVAIKHETSNLSTPRSARSKSGLSPPFAQPVANSQPSPWHGTVDQRKLPEGPPDYNTRFPSNRLAGLLQMHRTLSDGQRVFQHTNPKDEPPGSADYARLTAASRMATNKHYPVLSSPHSQQHFPGHRGTHGNASSATSGFFSKSSSFVPYYDTVREQASSSYRAPPPSIYPAQAETDSTHADLVSLLMAVSGRSIPRTSSSPALPMNDANKLFM